MGSGVSARRHVRADGRGGVFRLDSGKFYAHQWAALVLFLRDEIRGQRKSDGGASFPLHAAEPAGFGLRDGGSALGRIGFHPAKCDTGARFCGNELQREPRRRRYAGDCGPRELSVAGVRDGRRRASGKFRGRICGGVASGRKGNAAGREKRRDRQCLGALDGAYEGARRCGGNLVALGGSRPFRPLDAGRGESLGGYHGRAARRFEYRGARRTGALARAANGKRFRHPVSIRRPSLRHGGDRRVAFRNLCGARRIATGDGDGKSETFERIFTPQRK